MFTRFPKSRLGGAFGLTGTDECNVPRPAHRLVSLTWSHFVGQVGGRAKVYFIGESMPPESCLTRRAVLVEPAEGQASGGAQPASPSAFLCRRSRSGWSPPRRSEALGYCRTPSMRASTQNRASRVLDIRQASTRWVVQSMTATTSGRSVHWSRKSHVRGLSTTCASASTHPIGCSPSLDTREIRFEIIRVGARQSTGFVGVTASQARRCRDRSGDGFLARATRPSLGKDRAPILLPAASPECPQSETRTARHRRWRATSRRSYQGDRFQLCVALGGPIPPSSFLGNGQTPETLDTLPTKDDLEAFGHMSPSSRSDQTQKATSSVRHYR